MEEISNLLTWSLAPYGPSGKRVWPSSYDSRLGRRVGNESTQQWFTRCVDDMCDGDPSAALVAPTFPRLAAFCYVSWQRESELVEASIQVIHVAEDIEAYYLGKPQSEQYLRLDYHPYSAPGPLLQEPLLHIHTSAAGPPRFSLPNREGAVISHFFDLVYRSWRSDDWMKWAEGVWNAWCQQHNERREVFEELKEAFENAHIAARTERYAANVRTLNRALTDALDRMHSLRVPAALQSSGW